MIIISECIRWQIFIYLNLTHFMNTENKLSSPLAKIIFHAKLTQILKKKKREQNKMAFI